MTGNTQLYFAYGSNMYSPRLRKRVPSARFVDIAHLPAWMVSFRKRGRDGSAKCDIEPLDAGTVWGVVYRIDCEERELLDRVEGEGYRRESVVVATADGLLDAFTYRAKSDWLTDELPFDWYLELVLAGALEHGIPENYAAGLAQTETRPDEDAERAAGNRP